jgi:hypothetical protein
MDMEDAYSKRENPNESFTYEEFENGIINELVSPSSNIDDKVLPKIPHNFETHSNLMRMKNK